MWAGMIQRCHNPNVRNYQNYGGRGIQVCERWRQSFQAFVEDMGPRPSPKHSLDRRENDGNYEPGNVRWATQGTQLRNSRAAVKLEIGGVSKCLADWSLESGVQASTIAFRLRQGWDVERAVFAPAQPSGAKTTPEQRSEIRARALAGESRALLARTFGISRVRVREIAGLRLRKPPRARVPYKTVAQGPTERSASS